MLKIESKTVELNTDSGKQSRTLPIINGILDKEGSLTYPAAFLDLDEKRPRGYFANQKVIELLVAESCTDLEKQFTNVAFLSEVEETTGSSLHVEFVASGKTSSIPLLDNPAVIVSLNFFLEEWKRPYSHNDLKSEFEKCFLKAGETDFKFFDELHFVPSFGIYKEINDLNIALSSPLRDCMRLFKATLEAATKKLIENLDPGIITTFFTFPAHIKTACKQYLVYFAQFLADLGIDAETEIKENLNETLFSVIPKNKEESLEKIREALDLFLNIPGSPSYEQAALVSKDIAVSQLSSQVMFLKSNLLLTQSTLELQNATIQAKNATIENLQLSNYQYRQQIETHKKEGSSSEELIKGIVEVKKWESKGVVINWPEILRKLKRTFK